MIASDSTHHENLRCNHRTKYNTPQKARMTFISSSVEAPSAWGDWSNDLNKDLKRSYNWRRSRSINRSL